MFKPTKMYNFQKSKCPSISMECQSLTKLTHLQIVYLFPTTCKTVYAKCNIFGQVHFSIQYLLNSHSDFHQNKQRHADSSLHH